MAPRKKSELPARYRIEHGDKFRLNDNDPADTAGYESKEKAAGELKESIATICELQETLYAQGEWSLLLVFQAMDAAGKDGTIKHVLAGVDPQGCDVTPLKAPSSKELSHDFLWRAAVALPERGRIGVFNRSYYEEVLVARVHPELIEKQKIPEKLRTNQMWRERFESINDFERHLTRNGTVVLKFFLHLSHDEQRKRLLERLDENEKNWKFEAGDLAERKRWKDYMQAYEEMVQQTSTKEAPWHIVPADHKWFTRLVVSAVIIDKLRSLKLSFPELTGEEKKQMTTARAALVADRQE